MRRPPRSVTASATARACGWGRCGIGTGVRSEASMRGQEGGWAPIGARGQQIRPSAFRRAACIQSGGAADVSQAASPKQKKSRRRGGQEAEPGLDAYVSLWEADRRVLDRFRLKGSRRRPNHEAVTSIERLRARRMGLIGCDRLRSSGRPAKRSSSSSMGRAKYQRSSLGVLFLLSRSNCAVVLLQSFFGSDQLPMSRAPSN